MRIRSITVFSDGAELGRASRVVVSAREKLIAAGYEVQTSRLALPPACDWAASFSHAEFVRRACEMERAVSDAGIDYLSLGPLSMRDDGDSKLLNAFPEVIAATERTFGSAFAADLHGNVLNS